MSTVVSRVLLGVVAALAVAGGVTGVVRAVLYFGADESVRELGEFVTWGSIAGMLAVLFFVLWDVQGPLTVRVLIACGCSLGVYAAGAVLTWLISAVADVSKGTEESALEDGINGLIWALVCGYVVWRVLTGRWPVTQHPQVVAG